MERKSFMPLRGNGDKYNMSVQNGKSLKMNGTLLPKDSFRVRRSEHQTKLLAAAGLDLFRSGLAFDGILPLHQEARHPAVKPNLNSIPEDNMLLTEDSAQSQVIVIIGGPLDERGEPGLWLSNRIAKGIQLYWKITKNFAEEQVSSLCYIIPTGADASEQCVMEAEAIRNAVVGAGISQHHIIMDCSAKNTIENAIKLTEILRHLHILKVHVVTSEFHLPRVKLFFDGILGATRDLEFSILYHGAPDGLSSAQRAEKDMTEQTLIMRNRKQLDLAIQRIKQNSHIKEAISRSSSASSMQKFQSNV